MEGELLRVIDALPGLVLTAFPDGRVDFLNQRWCEYTGLTVAEAFGWGWQAAVHPQDSPRLVEWWRSLAASGQPAEMEARLRRADGAYRWFLFRMSPLADASEKAVKWCGLITDIVLTRALDELKHSEGRLRTIVDANPGLVWSTAPDGSADFLNQRWLDYTGANLDDARGFGWQAAIHPEDAPRLLDYWRSLLESGQPGEIEARLRRFDGAYRWFLMRAAPFRDETGQIVKWFGQNTDIDDRKQAESLLAGEKRLLEMMAGGHSMTQILEALCQLVESTAGGCCCSVVVVDPSGARLEQGAAPSLPSSFISSTLGRPLSVDSGPCAMAARLNEQVLSTDLASETRWGTAWRSMALAHGLRACWATPISSSTGQILGAFAIYYDKPQTPTPVHRGLIARFTHIASIALERAQSDAALKRSEARKAAILNSALDCVVTIDHEGRITEFNPAAERTLGRRRDEVMGVPLADVIIPPSLREAHRQGLERYLATGDARVLGRRVELTALRADGSEFPVELAISRIPLAGPPSFTGYLRDITERKQAEEKLRRSEALLAASEQTLSQMVNSIPAFAWSAHADGRAEFFNQHYLDYMGLSLEQAQGWGWTAVVHPDDFARMAGVWQVLLESAAAGETEARLRRFDGAFRWFLFRATPVRDETGAIVRWFGVNTDIEDRKRAEEAQAASERNLSLIVNTMPGLASSTRSDGDLEFLNQNYLDYLGVSSEQVRRLRWDFAVHPDDVDGLIRTGRSAANSGAIGEAEARLRRHDGAYRWFLCRTIALRDESGKVVKWFSMNVDIDERKRSEDELRNTQAKLSQISRILTMSQLAASIAHEVNQPLSGIITNANTCLRMLAARPPNIDGALETARRTIRDGNRASEVIKRLRALFSRKELAVEPVDLNEAAREVIALSLSRLHANRVILRTELADDLPNLSGDRVQLQQVILNLMQNASDAMSAIDDRPRQMVVRTERDGHDWARLTVQDVGAGVSSQDGQKLFEPFYTTKGDGMGIGLSISRSIIERHGGRIWAAVNDGPGASFSFSIPISGENAPGLAGRAP